jgi:D-glycero-D-manno-heptose 1,7-bisphosphate phosphatase
MKKRALFLDRDGVINVDYGYVHTPDNFEFIDGIFELVLAAKRAGYLVIIVTNQAGIGRGYYTTDQFNDLTEWMKDRFAEKGAQIDAVYFCPHHPEMGLNEYHRHCDCRKPAPGMIRKAELEHSIDIEHSLLIGDRLSDIECAKAAGIKTAILIGEYYIPAQPSYPILPNLNLALEYFLTEITTLSGQNLSK